MRLLGFAGASQVQPVPYYGKVHAGQPALLPENRESFITVDRRFLPNERVFFLKVKGDSMIGCGIHHDDYVLVDPQPEATEGAIVVARLGEEATVKTYHRQGDTVVLRPANPAEEEIVVKPGDDFGVLGVLCGVLRPFMEQQQPPMLQPALPDQVS